MSEKEFTKEELKYYDGKDGRPAYVAVSGIVYDVSESASWKSGRHKNMHQAGQELTSDLVNSPHGFSVLGKFPVVGKLKK